MKFLKKMLLSLVLVALLTLSFACKENHEHTYSAWEITEKPTMDAQGKAVKSCECGDKVTEDVAKLSDESVWTLKETVDSTCAENGKKVYTSVYGEVTISLGKVDHKYGDWKLLTNPTETKEGVLLRECSECKNKETQKVAKLTDESVWTVKEEVKATCTEEGKKVYTSVYGDVTVVLEKTPHAFSAWTITLNPTVETEGKAERACACGEKEEVTISALKDTKVWTLKEEVKATCAKEGKKVYTSVYGEVTVVLEKVNHAFGAWTITLNPTVETEGKAERTCQYGDKEEITISALKDTKVWTLKEEVKPTCTEKGKKVYTSVYGEVTIVLEEAAHNYDEWLLTKDSTMEQEGTASRFCKDCGHVEEVKVPTLKNTNVWTVKVITKETCANGGEYQYTSVYGTVTVYTDAESHEYSAWTITLEPTEMVSGYAERTCKYGETDSVLLPNLLDSSVWTLKEEVKPTCTKEGKKVYTSIYGTVNINTQKIDHEYSEWTITDKPTLTEKGKAERTCKYGETETVVVPELKDSNVWIETQLVKESCTENGETLYTSIYGSVKVIIPTTGHKYGAWSLTQEPSLTETGYAVRYCVCGNVDTCVVPTLADTNVWTRNVITEPTCTAKGLDKYTSVYGKVVVSTNVVSHEYSNWVISENPTEKQGGKAERTCKYGEKEIIDLPNLLDASVWSLKEEVEPTCSKEGKKVYTSTYGDVTITIEKLPHTFGDWKLATDPTETATGTAERECACGEKEIKEVAKLTDPYWTLKEEVKPTCDETGSKVYTSELGEVTVVVPTLPHSYSKWTVDHMPTETEKGQEYRVCSLCQHKETRDIAVLTDKTIWKVTHEVLSTCTVKGTRTYTSTYGEVTVELELAPHILTSYTITEDPTLENVGKARGVCDDCGADVEVEIPALSDKAWTMKSEVKPDYNNAGSATYESIYGEVTIKVKKLVAPYDGKTYHAFYFDSDDADEKFKTLKSGVSWSSASTTVNENSVATGEAFPFRGTYTYKMIDPETGKIEIKNSDGTTYPAYVDFATGIIVRAFRSSFDYVLIFTPYEFEDSTLYANASAWSNGMTFEYEVNNKLFTGLILDSQVYFNVKFEAIKLGVSENKVEEISAAKSYEAQLLYVRDSKGNLIQTLANTGSDLVKADQYAGYYTQGGAKLFISGNGELKYQASKDSEVLEGTYDIATGGKYNIDAYINNVYYEITLLANYKTFTMNKPMISLTFDCGDKAENKTIEYNKNIVCDLYEPFNDSYAFKGWYYDAEFTNKVEDGFKPTENVTLYALWKDLVIVNINGVLDGDPSVLRLGAGDELGDYLPKYSVNLEKMIIFKGWYLDADFEVELPEQAELAVEDSGLEVFAKWEAIPQYYGKYYGSEVYNAGYGNNGKLSIEIDEYGTIKFYRANGTLIDDNTGKISSYDKATQKVLWTKVKYPNKQLSFYFDEETGVIAGIYNDNDIKNDYYLYSRYTESTEGKAEAVYGVRTTLTPTSTQTGYYAQFAYLLTKKGLINIYLYNNHIYSNVLITDALGNELTVENIRTSKTVVVRDVTTREILLAVQSKGASFKDESNTITLDKYFGTYVNGEETIALDGAGNIVYGELKGTYALQSGSDNVFDVYFNKGTEYYQLTLNGKTFEIEKIMIEITFVTGDGHDPIDSMQYNKNIACTLPSGEDEGYVFNGYFYDPEFTKPITLPFIPSVNVTLYAKYSLPADLTIVYNNGEASETIRYSIGDIVDIEKPVYKKHVFVGWYTTDTFDAGSEWVSGKAINEDVTIYAKWEVAPVYNDNYYPVEIFAKSAENGTISAYIRTSCQLMIDPYGYSAQSAYPFSGTIQISDYDKDKGTLVLTHKYSSGSVAGVYDGVIDNASGIIILPKTAGKVISDLFLLVPSEKANSKIPDSYQVTFWNKGATKAIEYNDGSKVHKIFVEDGKVYFNVSFKDAAGNDIAVKNTLSAETLFVKDAENNTIAKYGYDGLTMVKFDGYEGTYTNGDKQISLNGVKVITIDGVKGEYQLSVLGDCTLYAFVGNKYYEVTLDKSNYTYTIVAPEAKITFVTDDKADVKDVTISKKVAYELPTPTNPSYVFRGWYKDSAFTEKVDSTITLLEDVTLYAKWDPKATLTVVYGNGYPTETIEFGQGDKISLASPKPANGKSFAGWYLDPEFATKYTLGTITSDFTIYANWMDAHPLYGSYVGREYWRGTTYTAEQKFTIDKDGKSNNGFSKFSNYTITNMDDVTNTFVYGSNSKQYKGWYEGEYGLLLINYNNSYVIISNDYYLFIKGYTSYTSTTSCLEEGKIRFLTLTLKGGELTTLNVFIYGNRIYANVTWNSAAEGAVTAARAAFAKQVSVYDSQGNLITIINK